ncbi:glycoside hydrolase family 13 protein [Actinoplanes sp. LDG1-06]|uniref:Glycoside hydrolase family 13 protein n=1 Tax=Paractinoplanes ovalisporus TaxID=2810368 RepID=A0ABS2AVC9_9ACTN|nr:glycoside hydrolase family 13 protein [Actinoplanes ovalisporus]MBM2623688.1 glycoside hydrolase family 13 protein [Actinoplanes ovalisporus]
MITRPHHDGSELYVSDPAPALGDTVTVFVRVPRGTGVSRVHMRWVRDGEPVFTSLRIDRRTGGDTWWRGEIEAHNPVTRYRFLLGTTTGVRWLTAVGVTAHDVPDSTDFRLVAEPPAPAWARDAVIYQIFPDRYARSPAADLRETPDWAVRASSWDEPVEPGPDAVRVLYGGDLDGIARRLGHVTDLGADTIYLTPFFPARSNHRYDAAGFDRVDPLLGGDRALERLSSAARERGLRLIGDLTTNHTGDAHPWFGRRPEFYYPGVFWLGVPSLPKLNWASPGLRREFRGIVQQWLSEPYGLSGWRIDVANMTARHGADDWNHEVAALLRRALRDARPDGLLIAEHGHDATGDLDRDGWHGTMNYAGFTRPVWCWLRAETVPFDGFLGNPEELPVRDAGALVATMSAFASQMSWRSWEASWSLLGSHDTARIRTVVGDAERQHVAAGLLFTLPGTPMVFAGDEIGLTGGGNESARVPMPWDRPWDTVTLSRYRELIALRKSSPALRRGGLRWVHADGDTLVFLRESAAQSVLVLARRAAGDPIKLVGLPADTTLENLYGGAKPLHIEPDGSTAIDGYGPAVQVWALP